MGPAAAVTHPQGQPGQEELAEGAGGGAPEHGDAPQGDGETQGPGPADPVGQDAEGQGGHGTHQGGDGHQEPDVGVVDVEVLAELDGRGAHGGHVGAAESEDAGQDGDDLGPGGSAQGEGQSGPGGVGPQAGGAADEPEGAAWTGPESEHPLGVVIRHDTTL